MGKKRTKHSGIQNALCDHGDQKGKAPISLCMIVKDEERFLPDCLKSVADLVAEMIIVDTGSTDQTMAIAQKFGARIYQIEWENDFAKARNYGLNQATQPWILYLDADERLHPPYHPLVRQAVACADYDAYYVRVRSEVSELLGKVPHIQAYPRLFRKKPGVYFVGRIHEQITPAIQKQNGRFALLDVEIEHLGYNLAPEVMEAKVRRNLASLKQQVQEEPDNAYARFQLGQTYIIAGKVDEGKSHLRKALQVKKLNPPLKATITLILANEEFRNSHYPEALEMIKKAVKISPQQRLGWFLLSECYAKLGKYSDAIAALEKYIQYANQPFSDISVDKIFDMYLIEQRLGVYYLSLKVFQEATEHLVNYFSSAPAFRTDLLIKLLYAAQKAEQPLERLLPHLDLLINNLSKFDRLADAVEALAAFFEQHHLSERYKRLLEAAAATSPDDAKYPYFLGNYYLQQELYHMAQKSYLRALELSENVYEIYYNLAVVAIKQGDYSAAIDWFQQIRSRFPDQRSLAERKIAALYLKLGDPRAASEYISVMDKVNSQNC